jgi:hypothetical protein
VFVSVNHSSFLPQDEQKSFIALGTVVADVGSQPLPVRTKRLYCWTDNILNVVALFLFHSHENEMYLLAADRRCTFTAAARVADGRRKPDASYVRSRRGEQD